MATGKGSLDPSTWKTNALLYRAVNTSHHQDIIGYGIDLDIPEYSGFSTKMY